MLGCYLNALHIYIQLIIITIYSHTCILKPWYVRPYVYSLFLFTIMKFLIFTILALSLSLSDNVCIFIRLLRIYIPISFLNTGKRLLVYTIKSNTIYRLIATSLREISYSNPPSPTHTLHVHTLISRRISTQMGLRIRHRHICQLQTHHRKRKDTLTLHHHTPNTRRITQPHTPPQYPTTYIHTFQGQWWAYNMD